MGREVGGGIGMGKTCEPKAFSFQCMTKFTTNKKKKKRKKKLHPLKCIILHHIYVCSFLTMALLIAPFQYISCHELVLYVLNQVSLVHLPV